MTFNRREFVGLAGAAAVAAAAGQAHSLVLIDAESAARMRDSVKRERAPDQFARLDKLAAEALQAGPWSVTYHRPSGLNVDAGPNDYVSEGPYWWPDPKNPAGPYIRKDGQRNPGRFMGNRNDLGKKTDCVLALGMGAFLL